MRKPQIEKAILLSLGLAGLIAVSILVPNLTGVFGAMLPKKKYSNYQLKRSLINLSKKKYIDLRQKGDKIVIELTEKGKKKLLELKLDELTIIPQKKWDKKWRIVIFDVPEKYALSRKMFVAKLKEMGLLMLQKSVWVCPYPCGPEIEVLKGIYEIWPFVRLITAEEIDFQNRLVEHFKLK